MADTFYEYLISQVEMSRILWDMKHKHYHNKLLVDREWSRIAADLREAKETVKTKWRNLRDKFKKEFSKLRKGRSGDDGDQASRYRGSWPYFESMLFLKAVVSHTKTEGNMECTEDRISQANFSQDDGQEDDEDNETQRQTPEPPEWQPSQNTPSSQEDPQFPVGSQSGESSDALQLTKKKGKRVSRLQQELEEFEKTSPDKNTTKTPIAITSSRKRPAREKDDLETELLKLENKKVSLLEKQSISDDCEDMNFFKSLLPHVKQLPSINKLIFRSQAQKLLINELVKVQNNVEPPTRNVSSLSSASTVYSQDSPGTSYQLLSGYEEFL